MYVMSSDVSMSGNEFDSNKASGGGTVFWEHASGMREPGGLQSPDNIFLDSNYATYGTRWATEAHHTRLLGEQTVFAVEDYYTFAPAVGVILQDLYDQVVLTDSVTLATVHVAASVGMSCYGQPGFVSGTTTMPFLNGTATYAFLEPICAPNHSLALSVTPSSGTVIASGGTTFEYSLRPCFRGEYFGERICTPCEEGTYSFVDPAERELSELTKSEVCQPCPSQASRCYQDTIVLIPGYWRSDNTSTNIVECPWHEESCRGGRSSGDASCGDGYHGPLCAVCEDDHHFVASTRTCEPCGDTASFFDPFMIVVLVIAFVVVVLLAFGLKRASRDEAATTMDGLIAVVLLRLKVYRPDTFAKEKTLMFPRTRATRRRAFKSCVVYITFYQIVSTLPFILADVEFPDVYDTLMSAVSVVNFAINQDSIVSCSLDSEYDYVTKLVISTTFPMVCAILLWVCSRVHVAYIKSASGGSGDGGESGSGGVGEERTGRDVKVLSNYKKAILVLSFLILPSGMSRCCMDMCTYLAVLHGKF
jgi:hypothetical protein